MSPASLRFFLSAENQESQMLLLVRGNKRGDKTPNPVFKFCMRQDAPEDRIGLLSIKSSGAEPQRMTLPLSDMPRVKLLAKEYSEVFVDRRAMSSLVDLDSHDIPGGKDAREMLAAARRHKSAAELSNHTRAVELTCATLSDSASRINAFETKFRGGAFAPTKQVQHLGKGQALVVLNGGHEVGGSLSDISVSASNHPGWKKVLSQMASSMDASIVTIRPGARLSDVHADFVQRMARELHVPLSKVQDGMPYMFLNHIGYQRIDDCNTGERIAIGDVYTANATLRLNEDGLPSVPPGVAQFKKMIAVTPRGGEVLNGEKWNQLLKQVSD